MPYCDWDDDHFDTLIYSIRQNNCILMLGPDAATESIDGQPRVLTETLSGQLAERIDPVIKNHIHPFDLAQVSQNYCAEKGRLDLEARVSGFYKQRKSITSPLHQHLAALDFYFTITTTPDYMFSQALEENGKTPVTDYYNFKGEKPGNVVMGTTENPLLYYLYGAITNPKSLLLTENDLLDFLVALISRKPPLPDNIRSELQDENKSFLFLGFGFRHWYLRILLHVLQGGQKKGSPSFALEQFTPENTSELTRNAFFFRRSDYKIHIVKEDLNSFVERLREKYEYSWFDLDPGAPEVFICYAGEDKEYALQLYQKLKDAGIKPWMDKENLRGGDNWDKEIGQTLQRVDYCIVLQSQSLAKKQNSYVNREIERALERQKENDSKGFKFIIPVRIDDGPLLENLIHIHTTDLTGEKRIKELISTIKRDFAIRGNH
ncbi:MAG: toll/interleukin-1 receptor domain-containing protein [Candidatus Omnitrophota bacterium]